MIIVLSSILVSLLLICTAFVSFMPNMYTLLEKDLMRRVQNNAELYGLKYSQIAYRAKNLSTGNKKTLDIGYAKKQGNTEIDTVTLDISMPANDSLDVKVNYNLKK